VSIAGMASSRGILSLTGSHSKLDYSMTSSDTWPNWSWLGRPKI